MRIQHAAEFAETILAPDYRAALDAAYEQSPEGFVEQREITEDLIVGAMKTAAKAPERMWELRRQAAITELDGTDLGPFNDYLQDRGGETKPSDLSITHLEEGKPEVIRTNSRVISLNKLHDEPIDFMSSALEAIADRKRGGRHTVGPENYATAIKFFADKYLDFPSSHLDPQALKAVVDECMDGFVAIAKKDQPNFVEMTNVYYAIRTLPTGTFDKSFTKPLIAHSLEQLPNYNPKTLSLVIASMAKLDLSETGESAATLMDLAMRKKNAFENTREMGQALRSIANLPATEAANRVFATFMEVRNNLEEPLDIDGLDGTNDRLLHVIREVIDDPELSVQARELGQACAKRAVLLIQQEQHRGELTPQQMMQRHVTVKRIISNFSQM